MKHTPLTKAVKTRLAKPTFLRLEEIASARDLKVSHVVREAIKFYIASAPMQKTRN